MALYFEISGKIFKSPDRIIIGRGEPFSIFNDDHDISRAHVLIVQKKGKLYLKDLGSEKGTIVNGKKVSPKKLIAIDFNDKIFVGKYPLKLFNSIPLSEALQINRSSVSLKSNIDPSYLVGAITFGILILSSLPDGIITKEIFTSIFLSLLSIFLMKIVMKGLRVYFGSQKAREAFISDDGFTIHYLDGHNMTFKYKDIDHWAMQGSILSIWIYDNVHHIQTQRQLKSLIDFLKKNLHSKNGRPKLPIPTPTRYVGGVLCLMMALGNYNIQLIGNILGLALCLLVLFNDSFRIYWPIQLSSKINRKKQSFGIWLIICFLSYSANSSWQYKKNIALAKECMRDNESSCKKLNVYFLDKKYQKDEVLQAACRYSNETACVLAKKRDVAGQKNE